MAQAVGIGGIFLRSPDPKALQAWYQTHLGIDMSSGIWMHTGGPMVFAPFTQEDTYFPTDRAVMLNFRVDDLDALLVQLTGAGITSETRPDEWDGPHGRFARIHDPDGNPVELWQPPELPPDTQPD